MQRRKETAIMITNSIIPQTDEVLPDISTVVSIVDQIAPLYEKMHPKMTGRPREYSDRQILTILVIKELAGQSFRSMGDWFCAHHQYLAVCKLDHPPSFQTLSYRCSRMKVHDLNDLSVSYFKDHVPCKDFFRISAVDAMVVKPCKDHRAQNQRKNHHYHDPNASWTVSTKQDWEYGYKTIIACDALSSLILGYRFETAKVHEVKVMDQLIPCFERYAYLLLDAAYDSYDCFYTLRKKTSALPIIDINPRGTSKSPSDNDRLVRWLMKSIRIRYAELYKKRWEIERINNVLESQLNMEFIFYTRNRYYEQAVGIKIFAYNIQVICNLLHHRRAKEKIVA